LSFHFSPLTFLLLLLARKPSRGRKYRERLMVFVLSYSIPVPEPSFNPGLLFSVFFPVLFSWSVGVSKCPLDSPRLNRLLFFSGSRISFLSSSPAYFLPSPNQEDPASPSFPDQSSSFVGLELDSFETTFATPPFIASRRLRSSTFLLPPFSDRGLTTLLD